jgi:two-component system cell cycle sensor histidine kinase/response regulator CckA
MAAPQADPAPVVLVVDDEPVVLRLMARALGSAGYEVHAATNGLQALEVVSTLPVPPAILVTDLRMEPIDGASLARLVAHLQPGTRILFVSGWDADHLVLNVPLLRKPFSPGQLVEAVQDLLRTGVSPEATPRGDELR